MEPKIIRRFFLNVVEEIHKKRIHGVIAVNMACISESMADAYSKIGKVKEAGGVIYTVEEGNLGMNIHMNQVAKEENS